MPLHTRITKQDSDGLNATEISVLTEDFEKKKRREKFIGTTVLGTVAIAEFLAEQNHITQLLPEPARAVAESLCHLVIGYGGRLFGPRFFRSDWGDRHPVIRAVVGVTMLNVAVESLQDLTLSAQVGDKFTDPKNQLESLKDESFAYIGLSMAAAQERHYEHIQNGIELLAQEGGIAVDALPERASPSILLPQFAD